MFTPKQDAFKAEVRRLMDIYDWTQGTQARNAEGHATVLDFDSEDPKYAPVCFCALGFMRFAMHNLALQGMKDVDNIYLKVGNIVYKKINKDREYHMAIPDYNDEAGRTAKEVRALFE